MFSSVELFLCSDVFIHGCNPISSVKLPSLILVKYSSPESRRVGEPSILFISVGSDLVNVIDTPLISSFPEKLAPLNIFNGL